MSAPDVGVVGARLLYADERVQHAGVVLGIGGVAGHSHKYANPMDPGYFGRTVLAHGVSAVTGACLLTHRELFLELGGLDEVDLSVAFNDVDYCLKVRASGRRIVYTPYAELFHLESASRGLEESPAQIARFNRESAVMRERWGTWLRDDPAYNPNLTDTHEDFRLGVPPRVGPPVGGAGLATRAALPATTEHHQAAGLTRDPEADVEAQQPLAVVVLVDAVVGDHRGGQVVDPGLQRQAVDDQVDVPAALDRVGHHLAVPAVVGPEVDALDGLHRPAEHRVLDPLVRAS